MKLITKCLSVCAALSIAATSFYATPMNTQLQPGEAIAHKELVGGKNPDGSYTIKLSVKGKKVARRIENADIVFLATHADVAGQNLANSHDNFVDQMLKGKGNRVSIVTNCGGCGPIDFTDNAKELHQYMRDTCAAWTAEEYEEGLNASLTKGIDIVNKRKDKNRPVYVMITGIKPGLDNVRKPEYINFLKMNRTHTLLMGDRARKEIDAFKKYGEVEWVSTDGDLDSEVDRVFTKWANAMFNESAGAGENAVMTDIVNTDVFDYKVTDPALKDDGKGTLTWNIGKIPETPKEVTFTVTPKPGKYGTFKTNNDVYLKYTDYKYQDQTINKPEIGDPEVTIEARYNVTYKDGAEGKVFKDQVTSNLAKDSKTPEFKGTLNRPGYKFKGWTPKVSDKVTANATYTAQWDKVYNVTYTDGVDDSEIFKDQVSTGIVEGSKTPEFTGKLERPGYKFKGWSPVVEEKVTKDIKYVAQWEKLFNVTYKDGAEGEVFKDEVVKDIEPNTDTPKFSGKLEREGYKFKEWTPAVDEKVTKDMTYTATWDKLFTVTYTDGVDDAEVFADQVTKDLLSGDATPKFDGEPTREGYTFKGWSPEVSETVTDNVTYVAQWEAVPVPEAPAPKTYTVTYTDGVDDAVVFEDKVFDSINEGDKTPDFGALPTREGYTFNGWSPAVAETVTSDVTYVAQWKEDPKPVVQLPKTGVVTGGTITASVVAIGSMLLKRWF